MAKIVVFEDVISDAVNKYRPLFKEHDFTLLLTEPLLFRQGKKLLSEYNTEYIESSGLHRSRVMYYTLGDAIPEADFYFVDGLDGLWLGVMKFLPREKSYLVSGSPRASRDAVELGFRTFPGGALNKWYRQLGIL